MKSNLAKFGIFFSITLVSMGVFLFSSRAEQFIYDSHGKRDPFVPLIGQERSTGMVPFSEIVSVEDVKLEGIAGGMTGNNKSAIINGELIKEGFKSGEVTLNKIDKKSVILLISGKEYTVNLPDEGGQKE